jgi:hypothetical protein
MAVVTVAGPTITLFRAWAAFEDVLEDVARLRLEFLVVVGAAEHCADALEVEAVAGLLLVEALVVDRPFFSGGWAHVRVDALRVGVEGDGAGCYRVGEGEGGGDFRALGWAACLWACAVHRGFDMLEGA